MKWVYLFILLLILWIFGLFTLEDEEVKEPKKPEKIIATGEQYRHVEDLVRAGKYDEAEKMLNTFEPNFFLNYYHIKDSIAGKKAADAHYEAKRYLEAFDQYHNMYFKDAVAAKRSEVLVIYRIEKLRKEYRTYLTEDECYLNYEADKKKAEIQQLVEKYPKMKHVLLEMEEEERNCKAWSYAADGDYNYALTHYENDEDFAEHAIVLYLLAMKSKAEGSITKAKEFLYRIPVGYAGQYSKEILAFKEKYVPKKQWEQQYQKYHKIALTSSQKAMVTHSRQNVLKDMEKRAAKMALEEEDYDDYNSEEEDDYDYDSSSSSSKNKKSKDSKNNKDKKKKDKQSSKTKQTKYKNDNKSSKKSSSSSSFNSGSKSSSKSSGSSSSSRGKR
ncbi:hypothetical protein NQ117_21920 [Paenibacillus sp. SC116]|uniref:hypothetical protein n=1 Tax=Paenibacillus sp. SC116 TaxID=2968986 RepID=UPI00215A4DDC|nr:hypothetical protein [Paenibacillus sp. SC116]MCR8846346.1 hypothetical protein [Paenibacillus sp. SC116]